MEHTDLGGRWERNLFVLVDHLVPRGLLSGDADEGWRCGFSLWKNPKLVREARYVQQWTAGSRSLPRQEAETELTGANI